MSKTPFYLQKKFIIPIAFIILIIIALGGFSIYRNNYLTSSAYLDQIAKINKNITENEIWIDRYEGLASTDDTFTTVSASKIKVLETENAISELKKQQLDPGIIFNFSAGSEYQAKEALLVSNKAKLKQDTDTLVELNGPIFKNIDDFVLLKEKFEN